MKYLLCPLLAWAIAGSVKFTINSLRERRLAFDLIGYGGIPSTHTTIVTSVATLIAIKGGIDHPAFGVAAGMAFIVVLDALALRRHLGRQAEVLNRLQHGRDDATPLRERQGHTPLEVATGILLGVLVGWVWAEL